MFFAIVFFCVFSANAMKEQSPEETSRTVTPDVQPTSNRTARREFLSVKTNLLLDFAYMPFGYDGFCPIPNVAVEFYPRHGHFTFGAMFDCPWWKGNTTNHNYFEIRNYTLYTRYYVRNSNRSYSNASHTMPNGKAAFQGFYLSAYTHAGLYQIGFTASKGWVGEGIGAGLGLGYVLPLSHNGHWRMEFGAQVGYFWTQYDPYVYGCPMESIKDGFYYYDWHADGSLFKKRQHHQSWIGPTRIEVSLSYDLLYRRGNGKKGLSFRNSQRGGGK